MSSSVGIGLAGDIMREMESLTGGQMYRKHVSEQARQDKARQGEEARRGSKQTDEMQNTNNLSYGSGYTVR